MKRVLVAALAASVMALPASATVMVATWDGAVAGGTDDIGAFGAPGASLAGLSFEAVFTYDTAIGRDTTAVYDRVVGGSAFATPSPMISSTLTINGATLDVASLFDGLVYSGTDGAGGYQFAAVAAETSVHGLDMRARSSIPWPNLDTPFATTFADCSACFSRFIDFDEPFGEELDFAPTSLVVARADGGVAGVPEPASWALMILGFGSAGALLRRRRERLA